MSITMEKVTTIDLGHEQMLIVDGGRGGRVRVLHGATWLTVEGEPADTILQPGCEIALHQGRTLIEGLGPARLQIIEHAARGTVRWAGWLRQLQRRMRRHVVRLQFGQTAAETLC